MTGIREKSPGADMLRTTWARWSLAALLVFTVTALAESYRYDSVGRLASVLYDDPAGTLILYQYDANGNRVQQVRTTDRLFDSGFES